MSETADKPKRERAKAAPTPSTNTLAAASAEPRPAAPEPDGLSVERAPATAATRKPFGSMEQRLAYAQRKGYHRHWFNEVPGRIDRALEAGYNFVNDTQGTRVNRVVGVAPAGGPLIAFLMEIPQDWYDQDQKREQEKVDQVDAEIRSGKARRKDPKDGDGAFYTPGQGTSLRHGERSR